MNKIDLIELNRKLEFHYRNFDKSKISPDPLEFLHRYNNFYDIEISGIISSVFAYGNIKQIMNTLEKLHSFMSGQPFNFISRYNRKNEIKVFNQLRHRFYTGNDISLFFNALKKIYTKYDSLQSFFMIDQAENEIDIKERISSFSKNIIELMKDRNPVSHGIKFMFPDPFKGSACKRMNLFLRWMVRKDELDFGLWKQISPSKLIIPVDTHIASIGKELKLTNQKSVTWKMAEEITENLRKFDPGDPVKYDFALCHIGMRKMTF